MAEKTCKEFLDELASAAPAPGGGGASAMVGALGAALGSMVGNLTTGKKKYAAVQEDITRLLEQSRKLQAEMLALIDGDAEAFKPLAAAYKIPKDQADRDSIMEKALLDACKPPLAIMRKAIEGLHIQAELVEKGTVMAVSDAGVGAQFLRAALLGASLNIYINAKSLKDRQQAAVLLAETKQLEAAGCTLADSLFETVRRKLQ